MLSEENVPNEQLRRARHLKGWTQSDLAEAVGTDFETVSRWERGITMPSAYFREHLCRVLEKTPEELGFVQSLDEPLAPATAPCVFLAAAYADAERELTTQLKAHLQARGVTVFSSRTLRRQGAQNQRKALQEAIRAAQIVLVIASPEARASRHVQHAVQIARIYQCQVCAVWIAGVRLQECVPKDSGEFFATIDVREQHDLQVFEEIVATLEKVFHASNTVAQESVSESEPADLLPEPRNPYKGLEAFRDDDRGDFFGRERFIGELAQTLRRSLAAEGTSPTGARMLAIVGPSGSGKSSVVMAGFLPRLQAGALPGSQNWVYLDPIIPGNHPLEALAFAFTKRFPDRSLKTIREDLSDDSTSGVHLLACLLGKQTEERVVLFIDQFEEVFTQTTSEEERQQFLDLLVTAASEPQGPIIVILTLRADFYDRPMQYPELFHLLELHHSFVLPMDLKELRDVIEKPAGLPDVQMTFEENLVSDLLFEVQGQVGALPLLQFTLDQLFQRRTGHQLTLRAFEEIGGVKGAVAKHAETTYNSLPSEEHRKLARVLFLRLIDPGATAQDTTRRRIPHTELVLSNPKETLMLEEVTRAFTAARLLTNTTASGIATVEVSHEAVIREWTRLTEWLDEAREDVHLQRAISEDVAAWEQSGRSRDRLYRGSQLKEARAWVKRNIPSANEVAYLHASVVSRLRFFVSMIALLLILVSSMGGAMWVLTHQPPDPTFVSNLQDNNEPGSLRHAIDAAASRSTITFSASLHGTILLTVGDLNIAKDLSIHGPGEGILSISSGTSGYSIRVVQGAIVTIFGLSFKDSKNATSATGFIDNQGTLILNNSTISGNIASKSGGTINPDGSYTTSTSGGGGGISNEGTLTLNKSTILGNTAIGGGGIFNSGKLTLSDSTVSANTATIVGGGGILNEGILTLNNSIISANTTMGGGGGISNRGTLNLSNSTVSANSAFDGGGISIQGPVSTSTTTTTTTIIINSTISDNTASDKGGGIFIQSFIWSNNPSEIIQANLTFSIIYGNTAHSGGDITIEDWAFSSNNANGEPSKKQVSQVKIRNSIVAGNPAHLDSDIVGLLTSYGYNLFQDHSGATFDPVTRTQHGTDKILSVNDIAKLFADLAGLQDNGGPTRTYALAPGSPALDQIPLATCLVNGITTDQRGVKRPDGNETSCDIGAFESSS